MGEGVNIAVVDQGMDVGHEDLKDNVDIGLNYDSNLDEYVNYYGVTAACSVQGRGARAPYSEMGPISGCARRRTNVRGFSDSAADLELLQPRTPTTMSETLEERPPPLPSSRVLPR